MSLIFYRCCCCCCCVCFLFCFCLAGRHCSIMLPVSVKLPVDLIVGMQCHTLKQARGTKSIKTECTKRRHRVKAHTQHTPLPPLFGVLCILPYTRVLLLRSPHADADRKHTHRLSQFCIHSHIYILVCSHTHTHRTHTHSWRLVQHSCC